MLISVLTCTRADAGGPSHTAAGERCRTRLNDHGSGTRRPARKRRIEGTSQRPVGVPATGRRCRNRRHRHVCGQLRATLSDSAFQQSVSCSS